MDTSLKDYDYIVTPFHEKLSGHIPLPYPVSWFIFSCIILVPHVFILLLSGKDNFLLIPHTILGLLPCILGISTIWFSKLLERFTPSMLMFIDWDKEDTLEWYDSEIKSIFNSKRMCLAGLLMIAVFIPLTFYGPLMPKDIWAKTSFIIMSCVLDFLAGSMIYTMIRIWMMVCKLGKIKEIKVSVYQHPSTSVKAVGKLLSKITITIIIIYFYGISYLFFLNEDILTLSISLFFGGFVMAFFIFPQIEIHKIMSNMKHARLRKFSTHLEQALQSVTNDPSRDNVQNVRELFEIQQSLNSMGEWPFDTKLLLTILTSVAIPIVVVLLQMIIKNH